MATYSLGTSIKVNSAIESVNVSVTNPSANKTITASGYGVVNIHIAATGAHSYSITIGGYPVFGGSGSISAGYSFQNIYVGPGKTIEASATTSLGSSYITGVEFKNSP